MRMKCMRILPEMCASTLWPLSSTTRNIALGRGSITVPSTSMESSFGNQHPSFGLQMLLEARRDSTSSLERQASSRMRTTNPYELPPGAAYFAPLPTSFPAPGEDLRTLIRHENGVLEVGRELTVP